MRTFSFSIKPKDEDNLKLVNDLKIQAIQRGQNFSFIVLEALRDYKAKQEKANG